MDTGLLAELGLGLSWGLREAFGAWGHCYTWERRRVPGASGRRRAHLEEVVLVDDAAVGQRLDKPVGQRGFATVGDAETENGRQERDEGHEAEGHGEHRHGGHEADGDTSGC